MPVLPPYNRFDCCLYLLVVRLLEHGFLFLNWSGRVEYIILSFFNFNRKIFSELLYSRCASLIKFRSPQGRTRNFNINNSLC